VREAARALLAAASRPSGIGGGADGLTPQALKLLQLPEDSPGGVVTAAQLQKHASEVGSGHVILVQQLLRGFPLALSCRGIECGLSALYSSQEMLPALKTTNNGLLHHE